MISRLATLAWRKWRSRQKKIYIYYGALTPTAAPPQYAALSFSLTRTVLFFKEAALDSLLKHISYKQEWSGSVLRLLILELMAHWYASWIALLRSGVQILARAICMQLRWLIQSLYNSFRVNAVGALIHGWFRGLGLRIYIIFRGFRSKQKPFITFDQLFSSSWEETFNMTGWSQGYIRDLRQTFSSFSQTLHTWSREPSYAFISCTG